MKILSDFENHSNLKPKVVLELFLSGQKKLNRTSDRGNEEGNHDYILMNNEKASL